MKFLICFLLLAFIYINKIAAQNNYTLNATTSNNGMNQLNTRGGQGAFSSLIGSRNTVIGAFAYTNPTSFGENNSAFGADAMHFNSSGSYNTAMGSGSLYANVTGSYNTAVGYYALLSFNPGSSYGYNTAIGSRSLQNNTSGINNTVVGAYAYTVGSGGGYNVAFGKGALYNNIKDSNTSVGFRGLSSNTIGILNTSAGNQSLLNNIDGNYNIAIGQKSAFTNQNGSTNTCAGYLALTSNISGNSNVAIGDSTGFDNKVGSNNVFIGHAAGDGETGSNKLYISSGVSSTILYGDFSTGQLLIGNPNPAGYQFKGNRKLNVMGGILSDSIRFIFPATNWADYVFDKSYKLRTLNQLEDYIKINKHLPNIPSAEEVSKNGIDVIGMKEKLLEKIEEMYLYVIQLKKKNAEMKLQLEKNNDEIMHKIAELKLKK